MRTYDRSDTVFITCLHETYDYATATWTEADPDTGFPKVTIIDPTEEKKVDAIAMSKVATGKFQYLYEIAVDAEPKYWKGYIDVENGEYPTREYFSFKVKG